MHHIRWSLESALGHEIMVRRWGSGPDLIWIHGLGEQSASFDTVAAHHALAGWTHVLIDLPGYGRSPWPELPDDLERLAERLATWIGGGQPVLIGHSMGGVLATLIAEHVAPRAVIDVDGNLSHADCRFSAKVAAYTLDHFVDHGLAALRAQVYDDGRTDLPLRGYHAAMLLASPYEFHHHAGQLVELSRSETLVTRLAALRVPALFIAGVPGGICERSRELLDANGIRWIGIEPAAHWVHLDQPDRFATEVAGFLAGL